MILQIIQHTPIWVFVLFFILLVLGLYQRRDREIALARITILPTAMVLLSVYSVYSSLGFSVTTILSWLFGFMISIAIGLSISKENKISYLKEVNKFYIPGSWVPLSLMMLVFMTRYGVGIVVARQLPILDNVIYTISVSVAYGIYSGAFFLLPMQTIDLYRKLDKQK